MSKSENSQVVTERRGHPRIAVVGVALPAASVICTQLLLVITCAMVPIMIMSWTQSSPGQMSSSSPEYLAFGASTIAFGLCALSAPLVAVIGFFLSMIGYRRPGAERTFPVLGLIANGGLLFFSCGILGLTLLLSSRDIINFINSQPNF